MTAVAHVELDAGELVLEQFTPNKQTYIKEHVMLAALGSVLMVGVLYFMGDPNLWVGIVGAVVAIAVRGFYVASEQLAMTWQLTNKRLIGPDGRTLSLGQVADVRYIFSAAQVITQKGDKYLLKYQADPKAVRQMILSAKHQG